MVVQGVLADVQKVMNSQPKVDENLEKFLAEYEEYKLQNTERIDLLGLNPGDNTTQCQWIIKSFILQLTSLAVI